MRTKPIKWKITERIRFGKNTRKHFVKKLNRKNIVKFPINIVTINNKWIDNE